MTPKPWRTVYPVLVLSLLTVAGALAPITASAGPARPQARPAEPQPPVLPRELHGNPPAQPAQPPAPAPGLFDGADAQQTREELRQVLRGYPPSVAQVLRLDPTLAGREDYLSSYPALAAFLAQHAGGCAQPGVLLRPGAIRSALHSQRTGHADIRDRAWRPRRLSVLHHGARRGRVGRSPGDRSPPLATRHEIAHRRALEGVRSPVVERGSPRLRSESSADGSSSNRRRSCSTRARGRSARPSGGSCGRFRPASSSRS